MSLSLNVEQFLLGGISFPTFSVLPRIAIEKQVKNPCNPKIRAICDSDDERDERDERNNRDA